MTCRHPWLSSDSPLQYSWIPIRCQKRAMGSNQQMDSLNPSRVNPGSSDGFVLVVTGGVSRQQSCGRNRSLECSCHGDFHQEEKTIVFPRTKVIRESSMKKIVLISPRSTVQPKIVIPPGLFCKYSTNACLL